MLTGSGNHLMRGADPRVSGRSIIVAVAIMLALAYGAPAHAQNFRDMDAQSQSFMLARNAKQLCSVIFVVGRTPEEAMAIGDVLRWQRLTPGYNWSSVDVRVDLERKRVTLGSYPAPPRTAVYNGGQGCTMLPAGSEEVFFKPVDVTPKLSAADKTPWPMGDAPDGRKAQGINQAAVEAVLDVAFKDNNPEAGERGWVVLHDGVIVGERYGRGYDRNTKNLSFSAGKSIEATLAGILVRDGHLNVDARAPIAEWAAPDARSTITTRNLMNMAGGLACNNYPLTHPLHFTTQNHHHIGYNDGVDAFQASIAPPLRFVPGTVYSYLNCDLLAVGKIIRQIVEKKYEVPYLAFPQRYLFDKIGMRNVVLETDPWGNFLLNGHNYVSTRDWARFGLLYQQDGVFNGERILPEGWTRFVSTRSAANPGYGAFFWLTTPRHKRPKDSYWASGAEGQEIIVMPSHGIVLARNAWSPVKDFETLVAGIAAAVIKTEQDCRSNDWRKYGFDDESQCTSYVAKRGPIR